VLTWEGEAVVIAATWVGGPYDGETLRLADNIHTVEVVDPDSVQAIREALESDDPTQFAPPPKVLTCPVLRMSDGRRVIQWPT
jgi:hypothetical protein